MSGFVNGCDFFGREIKPAVGKSVHDVMAYRFHVCEWIVDPSTSASTTSPKLCGGILVAMPTAIPDEPLISKLGACAARLLVQKVAHRRLV